MYATFWALVPPIVAILLALITKEVYISLFVGIMFGGFFIAGFDHPVAAVETVFRDGIIGVLSDPYNVGILVFLVFLGIIVALMNRAGGSAAFGKWASEHIKSRVGAQIATIVLGCLIFIDDYFNCLTVGSVMRPVTDRHKISRAKLAYLIDATAAPICIIAPVSSWAAAVSGFAPEGTNGLMLFISAIPYNYYAILTIIMMLCIAILKIDYGPMVKHENNALKGDLFTLPMPESAKDDTVKGKGKVIDLILPVASLIVFCVLGMVYTGGYFETDLSIKQFAESFGRSDASVGLTYGSFLAIVFTLILYRPLYRVMAKFLGAPAIHAGQISEITESRT